MPIFFATWPRSRLAQITFHDLDISTSETVNLISAPDDETQPEAYGALGVVAPQPQAASPQLPKLGEVQLLQNVVWHRVLGADQDMSADASTWLPGQGGGNQFQSGQQVHLAVHIDLLPVLQSELIHLFGVGYWRSSLCCSAASVDKPVMVADWEHPKTLSVSPCRKYPEHSHQTAVGGAGGRRAASCNPGQACLVGWMTLLGPN